MWIAIGKFKALSANKERSADGLNFKKN